MEKPELFGLIISGIAGIITSLLHALKKGVQHNWKKVLLHFGLGFCSLYIAYLVGETMMLDSKAVLVVGFLSGLLSDRLINEMYRREEEIYRHFFTRKRLDEKEEK
ncbi:hypothetical protein CR164_00445 [Prosthecochloris marina]|uniref:Holin n=1 Tax=Prosthecochloris marina TaxID=2017681 RepID=A0A317TAY8_9CHLB|nr:MULTISPECIES: hypothetical protein [Prosthecochloris]PWW83067.1 hypothetical protein CR164_00445 [Prosthecochloris marina]